MSVIQLPAGGWRPRDYQEEAWCAFEAGVRRFSLCWHRRAGKDEFALQAAAVGAHTRIGSYWHMLPQANQARKAIWDAINPHTGRRRIDEAFPEEIREVTRENEMFIRFKFGSTWQVVGSDNYDALVGSPPIGVVGSEWALANPAAWDFLRPILAENGGWAMFISTPRGRNHFADMHEFAMRDPNWFAQTLGVSKTRAIKAEVIEQERKELAATRGEAEANAIIAQEYECSFDAALPGAYFGEMMSKAEAEGRIGEFVWDPRFPVCWGSDLGQRDSTTFWFYQHIGGRVRFINFFEGSGVDDVGYYARKLLELPYVYGRGLLPHDGGHKRLGMAGSIADQMRRFGVRNEVVPVTKDKVAAINHARLWMSNAEWNTDPEPFAGETRDDARARMQRGMLGVRMYRRQWNEQAKRFDDRPLHDWASNIADGLLTCACGDRPMKGIVVRGRGGLVVGRDGAPREARYAAGVGE